MVFHPNALIYSYWKSSISLIYRCHRLQKKREYEEHIHEVESGSFTPLVFSKNCSMGREGLTFQLSCFPGVMQPLQWHSSMTLLHFVFFIAKISYNVHTEKPLYFFQTI